MGLTATDKGGVDFDPIPQGTHHAICYSIFDLGTQFNDYYGKRQHKVLFCWELPEQRIQIEKDGEEKNLPRATSKQYTLSLGEKANLRKDLETWRGRAFTPEELKGFDLRKVLGANCFLQIIHKDKGDKTYANVTGLMELMPGREKRTPENPLRFFSLEDNDPIPEGTPEWIVKIIGSSEEFVATNSPEQPDNIPEWATEDIPEDDMPF